WMTSGSYSRSERRRSSSVTAHFETTRNSSLLLDRSTACSISRYSSPSRKGLVPLGLAARMRMVRVAIDEPGSLVSGGIRGRLGPLGVYAGWTGLQKPYRAIVSGV